MDQFFIGAGKAALGVMVVSTLGIALAPTACHLSAPISTAIEGATGTACDTFLPLATSALPPAVAAILGPLDVLICAGAEAGVTAALSSASPPAPDGGPPVMASSVMVHHVLRQNGRAVALVRGPAWLVTQAQAAMDAAGKDGGR